MSYFIELIESGQKAGYKGIIEENDADHFHAIGLIGEGGLFTRTTAGGTPDIHNKYTIAERTIFFKNGVKADNGDFLLHGSMLNGTNRNKTVVVRVNSNGSLIWCKTYTQNNTRDNMCIVKSGREVYYLSSWIEVGNGVDAIEVIRINATGIIQKAVNITTGSINQSHGMIPVNEGVVLYGGTTLVTGFNSFIIQLNSNLASNWSYVLKSKSLHHLKDIVQIGNTNFVMCGLSDDGSNTYILNFNRTVTSHPARRFNVINGIETGDRRIIKTETAYYILGSVDATEVNFVMKFNTSFNLQWVRKFDLDNYWLRDINNYSLTSADELLLAGHQVGKTYDQPLLASTDMDLSSCKTIDLPIPDPASENFESQARNFAIANATIKDESPSVNLSQPTPEVVRICPKSVIDLTGDSLFQSPYVYMQSAGSDESDDSVRGFHLRWSLLKKLGDTHLPKGDYSVGDYPTTIGYNRADDYVRIYKTPYQKEHFVEVDFTVSPDGLTEIGLTREWSYQDLVPVASEPTNYTHVDIRFTDIAKYDILRSTVNPNTDPLHFMESYTGLIEVRCRDKNMFMGEIELATGADGLRLELVSLKDTSDLTSRYVSCRSVLNTGESGAFFCDTIEFIRFDYSVNNNPALIRLTTYDDYILGVNKAGGWSYINQFALDDGNADSEENVFKRLEDSDNYQVDNNWRKFNEPDGGEFRVNVQNYQDRWTMTEGLKNAVETYLTVSETDVKAVVTHTNDDPVVNDSQMDISYLDMLNFVGLDFHVARMLGLGHIDYDPEIKTDKPMIYLMQYVTEAQLADEPTPVEMQHFYMTPPTTLLDYRLPPQPVQKPVTYGIWADNLTGTPTLLTDPNGYNPYGPIRYINIHREKFRYEFPQEPFFATPHEFCLCGESEPVLFGLEYAPGTVADNHPFVRPEINHDIDWLDHGNFPEVSPIPNSTDDTLYIHEEKTEGYHNYALYSINWFSRVSQTGNREETDYTEFPVLNTLLPPSNFAVQLIQPENPRIFTSQQEQNDLSAIATTDKTYVRITFDWNQIQNRAYPDATGVELFWRENVPMVIQGKIQAGSVVVDSSTRTVTLTAESYLNASTNETVVPEILPGDVARFEGARMTVGGDAYVIVNVLSTGVNPSFKLKQLRQTASQDINNDNIFYTTELWLNPVAGDRFLISENLDEAVNWDTQLAATVSIEHFSTHQETVTYDDGTSSTFYVGGLTGSGTVADIPDPDPDSALHIPSGGPSQVPTGVYTITYDTQLLPPHPNGDPNATVDYQGGIIRLMDVDGAIKTLVVWKIATAGSVTVLTAYDPTFGLEMDSNGDYVLTSGQFTPLEGYTPVQTGSVAFLNFHPSYRVYVLKGGAGSPFDANHILPASGMGSKNTYMAARSIDSVVPLHSFMTAPSVLLAREILVPVPPGIPSGPLFATRPNFYGKATYTFDVEVENPFALIFFRASEQTILDQLYLPETVTDILADLAALESPDKDFYQDRWSDLANMNYDTATNLFRTYVPGGYRFPMPDNDNYKIPHANPSVNVHPFATAFTLANSFTYTDPDLGSVTISMVNVVKDAINGAFLPLTETPPIYKQLQDSEFQTSGRPPVIRDPQTGERYPHDHTAYDPWPMAFRYEKNSGGNVLQYPATGYGNPANTRFVRFTDFTLDGAARNVYFYFAVELSNTLAVSDRSPVAGPIQLVNSAPAYAPQIRKTTTQLRNDDKRIKTAVLFELNEYTEAENIRKIEIYRTTKPEDSLSARTMQLAKTVEPGELVTDDFSDQLFPLYGEPLFYRIVALREIINEQGVVEFVPSVPSNTALTNVVDNTRPLAPKLTVSHNTPTGSPIVITNVELTFAPTAYNATYYLYKQTLAGNWAMIHELAPDVHLNAPQLTIALSDTDLGTGTLEKQNDQLNPVYHRFRVEVTNSSGLTNVTNEELTV
jgi:hypothetical protein